MELGGYLEMRLGIWFVVDVIYSNSDLPPNFENRDDGDIDQHSKR